MTTFATASLRKRVLTTIILILLAATIIPYQFEFVVLCIVQLCTCVRALSVARETVRSPLIPPTPFPNLL